MSSVAPVTPQFSPDPLQAAIAAVTGSPDPASVASSPQPASVLAFNALMAVGSADSAANSKTVGILSDLFGSSAQYVHEAVENMAPLLRIPSDFNFSNGTFSALDKVFPSLPNAVPSPMELFAAQIQVSQIQLAWQLTGKMIGTSVQGVNTLVNSQV
jgi:hypothetical protein